MVEENSPRGSIGDEAAGKPSADEGARRSMMTNAAPNPAARAKPAATTGDAHPAEPTSINATVCAPRPHTPVTWPTLSAP